MVDLGKFIEAIQMDECRRANFPIFTHRPDQVEEWIKLLEKKAFENENSPSAGKIAAAQMGKYRLAYKNRPPLSRYEEIQQYLYLAVLLEGATDLYSAKIGGLPNGKFEEYALATIPIAGLNAVAMRSDKMSRVVFMFNVGLIPLIAAVARFVSQYGDFIVVPGGPPGASAHKINRETIQHNLMQDPEPLIALKRIIDALLFGTIENLPLNLARPALPKGRVYQNIFSAMTEFIAGHELTHIARGHFEETEKATEKYGEYGTEVLRLSRSQELEADALGLLYSLSAQDNYARFGGVRNESVLRTLSIVTAFYGADLVLSIFEVIEKAAISRLGLSNPEKQRKGTHPPFGERRKNIYGVAVNKAPDLKPFIDSHRDGVSIVAASISSLYAAHMSDSGHKMLRPTEIWRAQFSLAN